MRAALLPLALVAAAAGAGMAGSAPPHRAAAARVDWTRTVVATPEGGFRMGNPNARVKLIEYGSISCPHCAAFSGEAAQPLRGYVRSGRVSWEYRPLMIFPTDPGLFMLLRCQGAAGFFSTADRLYADQKSWFGKLQALSQEQINRINALQPKERFGALIDASGTGAYFHGMTPARTKACLTDDGNLKALVAGTEQANKAGVTGTPTFLVNGKLLGTLEWAALEPLIKGAGG